MPAAIAGYGMLVMATLVPARLDELRLVRRLVGDWLDGRGVAPRCVEDLQLAVSEAVANAAEHAFRPDDAGWVMVTVQISSTAVEIHVRDNGQWLDTPSEPDRGRGLQIIEYVSTSLEVTRSSNGTEVTFVVPIN